MSTFVSWFFYTKKIPNDISHIYPLKTITKNLEHYIQDSLYNHSKLFYILDMYVQVVSRVEVLNISSALQG